MKRTIVHLAAVVSIAGFVHADQTTQSVQQALKDQGFYYGNVTGDKSTETTAAIRRYQIRNGLQVTGDINPETLRSLNSGSNSASSAQPTGKSAVTQSNSVRGDDSSRFGQNSPPASSSQPTSKPGVAQSNSARPDQSARVDQNSAPSASLTEPDRRLEMNPAFSGGYYQPSPRGLNRRMAIAEVQRQLTSHGYYWGRIDGRYGPRTALALRVFQFQSGLPPTGHLDMSTLEALGLSNENFASLRPTPRSYDTWVPITKFKHGKWKVKWKRYHREDADEYGDNDRRENGDAWWNDEGDDR
jgi:peptidoglycan hydrolase-like protein with peptidoglycan-binding domain